LNSEACHLKHHSAPMAKNVSRMNQKVMMF